MKKYKGKGVLGAYAWGKVRLFSGGETLIRRVHIDDKEKELLRLDMAKERAEKELEELHARAVKEVGEEAASIFRIYIVMLNDEDYYDSIKNCIEEQSVNAEYAIASASSDLAEMFESMDNEYMQARAADIQDISDRLMRCLRDGSPKMEEAEGKHIICAKDLSPSETVMLDKSKVLAFVTAKGSPNSHTAILARTMNIPAVVGVGEEFLEGLRNKDTICVDGCTGEVVLDPDQSYLSEFKTRALDFAREKKLLNRLKGKENVTLGGKKIDIYANIGSVSEAKMALENDAGGVGLFRSEFLFLESDYYPDEEKQLQAYSEVLKGMEGRRVIIRTLDIGADKQIDYFKLDTEENPALGLRAIRLSLKRPELFKTQLRALYRASVFGRLGIMFPMITSVREVEKILAICEEVKRELKEAGIAFTEEIELGIMIETPAAAIISDRLAQLVDFFSVGTNDLTQYTLAADRLSEGLDEYYDPHHEAVLRLIRLAADNAHKEGKWIGICGELAADESMTEEFISMGIDELSVAPEYILKLRNIVRNSKL